MKVKILKSKNETTWYTNMINQVIDVKYDMKYQRRCFTGNNGVHNLYNDDIVITELPESFCVRICEDRKKLEKYIKWLNKTYGCEFNGDFWNYYGYIQEHGFDSSNNPFGTEIHIDDMIKHIDYMESQQHIKGGEQFSKESQLIVKMDKISLLDYAKEHYPIGTKYRPLNFDGTDNNFIKEVNFIPKYLDKNIEGGYGFIYANGKFAEIVKETNMEKQKLSRQGLKEIHSVACPNWKDVLEHYGSRNPLEDYIELSQEEVNEMFNACTKEQLPIVSKYLKQDDGSVDVTKFRRCEVTDANGRSVIERRCGSEYGNKSFLLNGDYNWEIKTDSKGCLCLIPTYK